MKLSEKIAKAKELVDQAGLAVKTPPHDPQGKQNVFWIFPSQESDQQIGCIRPSCGACEMVHIQIDI